MSFIECARKNARGQVKIIGNGSGKITINGKDITLFDDIQCREQVSNNLNNSILNFKILLLKLYYMIVIYDIIEGLF